MSRSFDGATTSLDNISGTVPVSAVPLTIVCWFKPAAIGTTQTLVALNTTGGGNHQFELVIDSTNIIHAQARDTTTSQGVTVGTVNNGAWNMAAAVFNTTTSRQAYLNGELGAVNANTRTPTGLNEIRIGKSRSGAAAFNQFANGLAAYAWIWNTNLTEVELDGLYNALAGGIDPSTVQGANLKFRTDLLLNASPEVDTIAALNLTVTAATFSSDNPFTISAGGGQAPRSSSFMRMMQNAGGGF